MRIKLYKIEFLNKFLHDWMETPKVNIWNLNFFVFKKSKHKEQVQDILKYTNYVEFKRKPINSRKFGPDQQSIYSPFSKFYDVEMEDREIIRLVFSVPRS